MADENEVSIVIKAVNDASGVLKQIAADVKLIATNSEELKKSLGTVSRAQREYVSEQRSGNRVTTQGVQAVNEFADANKVASASIEDQVHQLQRNITQIAFFTGALIAAAAVVKKAYDFSAAGAEIERLRVTGTALAKSFSVDMAEAVAKLKAASLGTLTAQQAMLATNRALLLGIAADTDKLAVLMQIAAIRGRAMGLNTTESFDRIVLGIGRLSTRILDDLGIVVDGETAYENYGAAIGKTADELTEAEKRIALTNAIIEDGNEILASTGGLLDDNATKFEQFTTNVTDFGNAAKEMIAGPGAEFVNWLNMVFFSSTRAGEIAVAHAAEVLKSAKSYAEYSEEVRRTAALLGEFGMVLNDNGDLVLRVVGQNDTLIQSNFLLSASEYDLANSTHELSEADKTAGAQAEQLNRILREREAALQEARDAMEDVISTSDKLSFTQAAQAAITATANENLGRTEKELQAMRIQFGLLDVEVMKFNEAIKKAAEDGVVSMNEFRDAFFPVAQAQIANLRDELGRGLVDIQDETIKKLNDLRADYESDLLKDGIDLARDLEDIELDRARALEDLTSESTEKRGDEEKKHKDKLVDIERDYQRDIDKIMRKFEMSRLRALIDLDARALFEAEQQRDSDLKDAKDTAKDKREDEEKDYEKRLEDLDDFNKEKREAIDKDYRRERDDAQTQYRRQRDDAERAMEDRRRDIEEDAAQRLADLATDFEDQKAVIESQLGIIQTNYQDAYNERVEDMLDFFDTNQNILLALKNGTVSLSDLRDQFNATGGIPFGGVPFTPDPSDAPPPPPTHNCQPGYEWNPVTMRCEQQPQLVPGNNDVVTPASGSVVGTVRLEITGDGALARMVRESAANVFAEIIAE